MTLQFNYNSLNLHEKIEFMIGIGELIILFLLIIATGITGIILVVTGIMFKNSNRWMFGLVLVIGVVSFSAISIGHGISSYYSQLESIIETRHNFENKYEHHDAETEVIIFNQTHYHFINSCISESDSAGGGSLLSFNIFADEKLLERGFYVSKVLFNSLNSYQFSISSEEYLDSEIMIYALDSDQQELIRTSIEITLIPKQSTECFIQFETEISGIPENFLFRLSN